MNLMNMKYLLKKESLDSGFLTNITVKIISAMKHNTNKEGKFEHKDLMESLGWRKRLEH